MRTVPWTSVASIAAACASVSCSVLNRVDACERVAGADFAVNARVDQDQIASATRSVARLSNGLYAATWISTVDSTADSASEVRVGLFTAEGRPVPTCGTSLSERTVSGADEVAFRPAIAASEAPGSPVYVVWQSRASSARADGPYRVRAAILDVQLCALDGARRQEVPAFDLSDSATMVNAAPAIAARPDGLEALAVWFGLRDGRLSLLARPLGVRNDPFGRAEPNACDASPAPCELAALRRATQPAIAALSSGYVVAWADAAETGTSDSSELRWQRFDRDARRGAQGVIAQRLEGLGLVFLSLTADRDGWALGWSAIESATLAAQRDSDLWLQRFDAQDRARAAAARINDRTEGVQAELSIAALGDGALFAAWTDRGVEGRASELRAITVGPDDRPVFNGAACDARSFALSGLPAARRRVSSVIASGDTLMTVYSDNSGTDPDRFGESVRGRAFSIERLLVRPPSAR